MADHRKGDIDAQRRWYRTASRVFADKGLWYFETREGKVEGPYTDKEQAKSAMDLYVKVMSSKFAPTTEFKLVEDEEHKAPRRTLAQRGELSGSKW